MKNFVIENRENENNNFFFSNPIIKIRNYIPKVIKKKIIKEKVQEIEEVEEDNNNTIYIIQQRLKIISINVGEDIKNRIKNIQDFIQKEKPDIFCLVETHTHYKDYSKIKGWFENKQYKVFYTAMSQKEYYEKTKEIKIKEIKNNKNLTEREKEIQINNWNANTMVYSVKYAGGIIVLVKSQIKQYFTESMLIPQNRGITLHNPTI